MQNTAIIGPRLEFKKMYLQDKSLCQELPNQSLDMWLQFSWIKKKLNGWKNF